MRVKLPVSALLAVCVLMSTVSRVGVGIVEGFGLNRLLGLVGNLMGFTVHEVFFFLMFLVKL